MCYGPDRSLWWACRAMEMEETNCWYATIFPHYFCKWANDLSKWVPGTNVTQFRIFTFTVPIHGQFCYRTCLFHFFQSEYVVKFGGVPVSCVVFRTPTDLQQYLSQCLKNRPDYLWKVSFEVFFGKYARKLIKKFHNEPSIDPLIQRRPTPLRGL